jgi:hypothetical protein
MKSSNKNSANPKTIDEKHTELMEKFHENETILVPQLKTEIEQLKQYASTLTSSKIDEYMNIRDQIKQKRMQIKELMGERKKYLLDNSKYIFGYFKEKKTISTGGGKQNSDAVNKFFKIHAKNESAANPTSSKYSSSKNINDYNNYWRNINGELLNIQDFVIPVDLCQACRKGELIPQDDEGILICNNSNCGKFVIYVIENAKPANKEPPSEVSYTAYIRLNHFKEILSQFQAKETTQIPPDVLDNIRARIKKERIGIKDLNYDTTRDILRKLGYNKYFEHIQFINTIFGIKPPVMCEELHETLCVLFIEIQKPWALHCPKDRTNFFNYTYTLYQLCNLLDQKQYLPYIPLEMKDREKQLEQDIIWKQVCADLDWEFFPTV